MHFSSHLIELLAPPASLSAFSAEAPPLLAGFCCGCSLPSRLREERGSSLFAPLAPHPLFSVTYRFPALKPPKAIQSSSEWSPSQEVVLTDKCQPADPSIESTSG